MLKILVSTAPIFILIAIGLFACRGGMIRRDHTAGLERFVITFALPALVIRALLERSFTEVADLIYMLAYGWAHCLFRRGYNFACRVQDSVSGAALVGLGMSVSNSGFFGYPIVSLGQGAHGRRADDEHLPNPWRPVRVLGAQRRGAGGDDHHIVSDRQRLFLGGGLSTEFHEPTPHGLR